MAEIKSVKTPGGSLTVSVDETLDEYPGVSIDINGSLAAVVEWHTDRHCFVLRTYNDHDEDPQHYHQWDGTAIV